MNLSMRRSFRLQKITTLLAALTLASLLPGATFAQGPQGGHNERHEEQRPDRDRNLQREREQQRPSSDKRDRERQQRERTARDRANRNDHNGRNDHDNRNDRNGKNDWNDRHDRRSQDQADADKRQKTKNDWRNLATVAGGATVVGILKKDPTITFVGAAGALYSLNRYEQDRKSQSQTSRARANVFSQSSIYRDGQRYDRRLVTQNGQKYYRFVKP